MEAKEHFIRWSEIEPACVLGFLRKKLWMVIMAAAAGTMIAAIIIGSLITKTYSCSTTFAVTAKSGNLSNSYYTNSTAASEVAAIYSQLLSGRFLTDKVISDLGGSYGSIKAEQLGSTNLIRVSVSSASPRTSLLIMQSILRNYKSLSEYVNASAVLSPLSTANMAIRDSGGYDRMRGMILGGGGAGLAMTLLLCWISISAGTIQNREGAKNNLDAKIIASIPHEKRRFFSRKRRSRSALNITAHNVSFIFAEAVNKISARFELENTRGKQIFLFTSVSEAEGKSTIAANAALSLAEAGRKTLFIDLDLRHPVQQDMLNVSVGQKRSFGNLLSEGIPVDDFFSEVVIDKNTGLHTLLSDRPYVDTVELISSVQMERLLARARELYDFVVIDSPPLGYFTDSELLGDMADGTVLVVRQDTVGAGEINDAIDALRACRAEFLGVVLNDMRHVSLSLFSGGSGSGYGYGYDYGYGKYGYGKYGYGKKSSK